ncbi:MAG: hypothetical protein U0359_30855 [Byssovorax sp.]
MRRVYHGGGGAALRGAQRKCVQILRACSVCVTSEQRAQRTVSTRR